MTTTFVDEAAEPVRHRPRHPAGDVRRFESLVSSLVVVARAADPPGRRRRALRDAGRGRRPPSQRPPGDPADPGRAGGEVDVRVAAPDEYGTVLFAATGSPGARAGDAAAPGPAAAHLPRRKTSTRQAGLPLIPPELQAGIRRDRSGGGRRAAGARCAASTSAATCTCTRPTATARDPLDGWWRRAARSATSTSRSPITRSAPAPSRTLTRADLGRQRDEIARHPRALSADRDPARHRGRHHAGRHASTFPDAVLEPLDIVLASLHDSAGQDARSADPALPRRRSGIRSSRSSPTRPTGSSAAAPAIRLDFDAIYAAAAETGTALEVDGAPVAPRPRRRARARGGRGRRDVDDRQRLPSRAMARPPDAARDRHGAARLGRAAPRAQCASARRGPRVHRGQAGPDRYFFTAACRRPA